MDSQKDGLAQIPFFMYEDVADRFERTQKRLIVTLILAFIAIIVLSVMIFLVNRTWARVWSEFDIVEDGTSIELESESGDASFIGRDGVINYGESDY